MEVWRKALCLTVHCATATCVYLGYYTSFCRATPASLLQPKAPQGICLLLVTLVLTQIQIHYVSTVPFTPSDQWCMEL